MTLIVSAHVDRDRIVQASDCRASFSGGRYSDTSIKTVVAFCGDGVFVMGYTGLGNVGSEDLPTDQWASETLHECPWQHMALTVSEFAERASALNVGCTADDVLTFAGAGFLNDGNAFAFTVSNAIGADGNRLPTVGSEFLLHVEYGAGILAINGNEEAAAEPLKSLVADLEAGSLRGKPHRLVADRLVQTIREAAQRPEAENSISQRCTSVAMCANGEVVAHSHGEEGSPIEDLVHLVTGHMVFGGGGVSTSWQPTLSASVPFEAWAALPVALAATNRGAVVRLTNRAPSRLSDITAVLNGDGSDFTNLTHPFGYTTGFQHKVTALESGATTALSLKAFRALRDGRSFDLSGVEDATIVVVGRLPDNTFAKVETTIRAIMLD